VSIFEKRASYKFLSRAYKVLTWLLLVISTVSCDFREEIDILAEDYVEAVFYLNKLSEGELDSYFGSLEFEIDSAKSIDELGSLVRELEDQLASITDPINVDRISHLSIDLKHLKNLLYFIEYPEGLTFAEEASLLYGLKLDELEDSTRLSDDGRIEFIERPKTDLEKRTEEVVGSLEELLPGQGSLPFRIADFQSKFIVPIEKREEVFIKALSLCKDATEEYWEISEESSLQLDWTRDVTTPWHTFLGNGQSVIQINPLYMGYIGSMIDVACHEGFPGHHIQLSIKEEVAVDRKRNYPERQIVLLRSPLSALLEGAADFAVELAFPPNKRLEVEKEILFPMAGLDPASAEKYLRIHRLVRELAPATIPTLQAFADEELPKIAASVRLENEFLVSSPMALLDHVETFSAYSVGYTLAYQQIKKYISANSSSEADEWALLKSVISDSDTIWREVFEF
tara:strand:- start:186 stop:1553 length:1368 start_codon:yes stop_codon:yes gene_type:complete